MTSQIRRAWELDDELPEVTTLRSGVQFEPHGDYWRFLDGTRMVYLDFNTIPPEVAPLKASLKRVLIDFLERNSPAYASNMFYYFRRLARAIAEQGVEIDTIETQHLLNAIASFGLNDKLGMESQLSALLTRWKSLGVNGVSDEAVRFLKSRRKKGNTKGEAVITLDPVKGPLSDLEFEDLMSAVTQAYAENRIPEQLYLLAWLIALTGQRVCQYCALKVKDVHRMETNGQIVYEIDIPKAKQQDELVRDSFLRRPLPLQIGEALWSHGQKVARSYESLSEDAPLFPTSSVTNVLTQLDEKFRHHFDARVLSSYLNKGLSRIAPVSHRTGESMHVAVGRFRDTIGTRAAQEGYGELVIAEILGHSDTQNVKCYVAVIPEIAQRLDRQLAKELAPIANAFNGRILVKKQNATRAGDPSSDIVDYANAGEGVGSCGTSYDCRFNAPVACYVCHNFEAWLDAPHEALLEHLLAERERLLVTSGPRIASSNDRVIIAIQSVIDTCDRMKLEEQQKGSVLIG